MKFINYLKGKKAYFVGAGLVAWGLYECVTGDVTHGAEHIAAGLSVASLRAGISKK
jgi:hypothetical protein